MLRDLEFNYLCRRHCDEIYRFARSLLGNSTDAENATQEVLLRIWKNLPNVLPINSVKVYLLRARQKLKRLLTDHESCLNQFID